VPASEFGIYVISNFERSLQNRSVHKHGLYKHSLFRIHCRRSDRDNQLCMLPAVTLSRRQIYLCNIWIRVIIGPLFRFLIARSLREDHRLTENDGHENDGHEIGGQDIYRLKITLQCSVQFFSQQRQNTSHSSAVSCIEISNVSETIPCILQCSMSSD